MTPPATVLIVDDSLTVRMDLVEAFEAAGFRAVSSATGSDALKALAHEEPSLVVLDVILPDTDGVELLKTIRAGLSAEIPILMLSTEAEVKDRIRGLQIGADDYVGKPYDVGYVVARARELILRRAPELAGKPTILVIDDSATFRQELRRSFEAAGYSVLDAASGEEGLQVAAASRPSAVVVDGVLPGLDGGTVIRKIRLDAALRGTPCLLLTGSDDPGAELRALDSGADAFVRKEQDLAVVLARLAAVLRAASAGRVEAASLFGPKRILAVDDSITYLHELAELLRREGYDVVLAHSGEEAIEMLSVQSVDCILLDLLMPGLGGKATCRHIKESPVVRDIPLIMLTALEDRASMIDCLSMGADDFISKSSEFEVLKVRVRAQMRRKQFEDEHRRIREQLLQTELLATQERAARELAEARAAHVDELEKKNRELEAFSYAVSHDLRAPLRGIDGFTRALAEDCGEAIDKLGRDHLGRVLASVKRMDELIDDLLELSRVGRADLTRDWINLSEIANAIVGDLRQREPGRRVTFVVEERLTAYADRRLVRVVLENLLGNAWKFTARAEGARIELGVETRDDVTTYFVCDNGAGFEMTLADKLFRPFQRLHSEADFAGTGIGLATVARVIERHGGRIWAEGATGRGATVFFTVPPPRRAVSWPGNA
jgi:two-component system NtrC family sensor kinase